MASADRHSAPPASTDSSNEQPAQEIATMPLTINVLGSETTEFGRFSGTSNDVQSLNQLLRQIDYAGEHCGWTEKRKVDLLPNLLVENASKVWQQQPQQIQQHWPAIKKALRDRFGHNNHNNVQAADRFRSRTQAETESVRDYANQLESVAFDAFGQHLSPDKFGEILKQFFVSGLRQRLKEIALQQCANPTTLSFAELVSYVETLEQLEPTPVASMKESASKQATPAPKSADRTKAHKANQVCFFCNKKGHVILQCRKRLSQTVQQPPQPPKPILQCWTCGKVGHRASVCRYDPQLRHHQQQQQQWLPKPGPQNRIQPNQAWKKYENHCQPPPAAAITAAIMANLKLHNETEAQKLEAAKSEASYWEARRKLLERENEAKEETAESQSGPRNLISL